MKNNFTIEQINNYAKLLLFNLTEEEASTIQSEFNVIENNMSLINQIPDIEKIEPAFTPYELYIAKMREDVNEESISVTEALKNCSFVIDREIEVPKVVGE